MGGCCGCMGGVRETLLDRRSIHKNDLQDCTIENEDKGPTSTKARVDCDVDIVVADVGLRVQVDAILMAVYTEVGYMRVTIHRVRLADGRVTLGRNIHRL